MTTVDPSGAIHDAKGRFAGHVAAESTGDLQVPEQTSATSNGTSYEDALKADVACDAAWAKINQAKDEVDSAAYDYYRATAVSVFPDATGLKLTRYGQSADWRVEFVDDVGQKVPMPGGTSQDDAFDDYFTSEDDELLAGQISLASIDQARFCDESAWLNKNAIVVDTGVDQVTEQQFSRQARISFSAVESERAKDSARAATAVPVRPEGCPDFNSGQRAFVESIEEQAAAGAYDNFRFYTTTNEAACAQIYDVYTDIEGWSGAHRYEDGSPSLEPGFYREGASVGVFWRDPATGFDVTHSRWYDNHELTDDPDATGADQARAIARRRTPSSTRRMSPPHRTGVDQCRLSMPAEPFTDRTGGSPVILPGNPAPSSRCPPCRRTTTRRSTSRTRTPSLQPTLRRGARHGRSRTTLTQRPTTTTARSARRCFPRPLRCSLTWKTLAAREG